jgi:hypothetical protein
MPTKNDGEPELSNAEIAHLLEQAVIRFNNWRVEAELNPNPHMVHSLANLIAIIDTLTEASGKRMQYSYKELVSAMAKLVDQTARLNNEVVASLADDSLGVDDMQRITENLMTLINSAVELIRFLQDSFATPEARSARLLAQPLIEERSSVPGAAKEAKR